MRKLAGLVLITALLLAGCNKQQEKENTYQSEVQSFLDEYSDTYRQLYYESSQAEWGANTYIKEGDSTFTKAAEAANKKIAAFTGSKANIDKVQEYLKHQDELTPLQVKQLNTILYEAANNPETAGELVDQRIKAETKQTNDLYGYSFVLKGKEVSPNEIDRILKESGNVDTRLAAWAASKDVGKALKPGLASLRDLRNQTVQALNYDDYFTYQVSDYGMSRQEMMETMDQMVTDIWPLYRELHTWARYELAKEYNQPVPEMIPAHWLPNRWAQDWSGLVEVEGIDLDKILEEKGAEWLVRQAEDFYVSLGFDKLPASFYEQSSLYPVADTAGYKKNTHASAWHLDLGNDIRSLMSVEPNSEWYETTHHELGHIYYFMAYTSEDVPVLLRKGANRGYHEAMGSLMGLAAMQKPYLQHLGLIEADVQTDEMQTLLKEALNYIVFIPFSAGTMTHFEHDLYAENLSEEEFNARWWEYVQKYQGVAPPAERGAEYCDACSKTHINNDAAQYYDYAMSYILLFQFHDHIAKQILKQDAHATNYYGSKATGDWLKEVMSPGGTVDWREHLKKVTGSELSAKPMLDYFAPLMEYLRKENEGRTYILPETPDFQ